MHEAGPRVPVNYSPACITSYGYPAPSANSGGPYHQGQILSRAAPPKKRAPSSTMSTQGHESSHQTLEQTATMTSTMKGTTTAAPSEVEIAKEYITNLQQQVYFLELELDLIKKQNLCSTCKCSMHPGTTSTNGTNGKLPQGVLSRGGAPKAPTSHLTQSGPANGSDFHSEDIHSIRSALEESRLDKTLVEEELQGVKKNFSERHANLLDDNIALEDKLEKLHFRLKAKTADLESTQADLAKERGARQLGTEKMQKSLNELESKLATMTAQLSAATEDRRALQIELETHNTKAASKNEGGDATQASLDALQQKIHGLLQDQHRMQNDMRAAELSKEQARQHVAKSDEFAQSLLDENTNLKTTLAKYQGTGSNAASSAASSDPFRQHATLLVDLRNEVKELKEAVTHKEVQLLSEKNRIQALEQNLVVAKEELSVSNSRMFEKENLLARLHAEETSMEAKTKELRRKVLLKEDDLGNLQAQLELTKKQIKGATRDKEEAQARVTVLEQQLREKDAKHAKVNASISQLMAGLMPQQ